MVMWSSDWRENPRNSGFFVKKCKRKRDNPEFFRTFADRNHNDKNIGSAVRPYGEDVITRQDTESIMQPQEAMLYV